MTVQLTVRAGGEVVFWRVDDWTALVALGSLSADPQTLAEFFSALRRYQPNHELDETGQRAAGIGNSVVADGSWCLIDLDSRSVIAGDEFALPERWGAFQADEGEAGDGLGVVWLDTPRDWLFRTAGDDGMSIFAERAGGNESREPVDTRAVLFGRPMLEFIAERVLANAAKPVGDKQRYQQMRAIHADWLMTTRGDLLGRTPREVLLYHHEQIDSDLQHRSNQWSMQGHAPPPLDEQSLAYRFGGFGTIEIVFYFDLMRSLLAEASDRVVEGMTDRDVLVDRLADHRDEFLSQPPPDGSSGLTCNELIECERRRMPVTDDESHLDCDCPICQAAAAGEFGSGPTFMFFDGHHLELEDEFAFSMTESREDWEQEQEESRGFHEEMDRVAAQRKASGEESNSVWKSSFVDWDNVVGTGNSPVSAKMALGFPLAELITQLQERRADRVHIDELNAAFAEFRRADDGVAQQSAAEEFGVCLERVATAHPDLTSRSADLQSRLDEVLRSLNPQPVPARSFAPPTMSGTPREPTSTTIPPKLNVVVYRSPGPSDDEIERQSTVHVESESPRPLAGGLGYVTLEPADFDRLSAGIAAGDAMGTAAAVLQFLGLKAQRLMERPREFDYCWTVTEETPLGRVLLLQVVPRPDRAAP